MIILRTIKQRNFFFSTNLSIHFNLTKLKRILFFSDFFFMLFVSNIFALLSASVNQIFIEREKKTMKCTHSTTRYKQTNIHFVVDFMIGWAEHYLTLTPWALTTNYGYGYGHTDDEVNDSSNVTKRRAKQIYELHELAQAQAHSLTHSHSYTQYNRQCVPILLLLINYRAKLTILNFCAEVLYATEYSLKRKRFDTRVLSTELTNTGIV